MKQCVQDKEFWMLPNMYYANDLLSLNTSSVWASYSFCVIHWVFINKLNAASPQQILSKSVCWMNKWIRSTSAGNSPCTILSLGVVWVLTGQNASWEPGPAKRAARPSVQGAKCDELLQQLCIAVQRVKRWMSSIIMSHWWKFASKVDRKAEKQDYELLHYCKHSSMKPGWTRKERGSETMSESCDILNLKSSRFADGFNRKEQ